tara:strand:- start:322 stop:588 length:267 start_codon:yes stop_codon:yes gene_type:complete
MWTTDALTNAGGWDLFSAVFFIFILYKAFKKSGRELVKYFLENCFKKVKNKEEKEIRNKFRGYLNFSYYRSNLFTFYSASSNYYFIDW